jgi:hypothetical protein
MSDTKDKPLSQVKREAFLLRADKLAISFDAIKQDPMNLNLVMAHIGFLSMTVDDLIRDDVDPIKDIE